MGPTLTTRQLDITVTEPVGIERLLALLQICEAGQDWIDVPSRKADDGAGVMTEGKGFKGRQFTAEVILWAVRWYLLFPISYRDLELMLQDRGVGVDHTTLFHWIQAYAPELEKRIRPTSPPTAPTFFG